MLQCKNDSLRAPRKGLPVSSFGTMDRRARVYAGQATAPKISLTIAANQPS
ncbi:hypothetical protein GL4_1319 [Methyloceanibacter caenitepidi]|uniref:Uncharacterized protein n=1 Tax=Methyloceanibacter caenitepidi TaxID=1384459 RepID=A0A0A8K2P0_9HYPH|nr:hypothetical protein GL4_1319 [Methyloceanibacter caenitepidi]